MELRRLVELVERVRATSRKTEKAALIADFLRQTRERETELAALYLSGTLPQGRIGVGWRAIEGAFAAPAREGEPLWEFAGPPGERPRGAVPWFDLPRRRTAGKVRVIFGHWAALGLMVRDDAVALDTGCVWGNALTAMRIEDRRIVQQENVD